MKIVTYNILLINQKIQNKRVPKITQLLIVLKL